MGVHRSTGPAPAPTVDDASKRRSDGGSAQKRMLFVRGNAVSGAPPQRNQSVSEATSYHWHYCAEDCEDCVAVTTTLWICSSPSRAPGCLQVTFSLISAGGAFSFQCTGHHDSFC